ncbi:MAG: hypothetical protein NTZ50_16450 [Chloroflexi bacterium]|nr:hypothetical protein [Chloroflexota bacterium]
MVNLVCMALTVWLLAGIIGAAMPKGRSGWLIPLVTLPLVLVLNGYALPMTGMEHTLHILTSMLIVLGLYRSAKDDLGAPLFTAGVIVLNAHIRFEGLALSIAAIMALLWLKKRAAAALAAGGLVIALGAFALTMHSFGLPVLPSSVLIKSTAASGAFDGSAQAVIRTVANNLQSSLNTKTGALFALCAVLFAAETVSRHRADPKIAAYTLTATAALLAHIAVGKYGWFGRYEAYAIAMAFTTAILIFSPRLLTPHLQATPLLLGGTVCVLLALPFANVIFKTPAASRNIYQQQYQMHRFATQFFSQRGAVNDLGWVSFQNDQYVLDLYGLGSEAVRTLKATKRLNAKTIEALTKEKNIAYAMLYEIWFSEKIPPTWCRMAVLHTSKVSTADGNVSFYSITSSQRSSMREALTRFASALPAGATRTMDDNPCS